MNYPSLAKRERNKAFFWRKSCIYLPPIVDWGGKSKGMRVNTRGPVSPAAHHLPAPNRKPHYHLNSKAAVEEELPPTNDREKFFAICIGLDAHTYYNGNTPSNSVKIAPLLFLHTQK